MPGQRLTVGPLCGILRRTDPKSCRLALVEFDAIPAVAAQLGGDPEPKVAVDAEVSAVVEAMNICPQEEAIGDNVRPAVGEGLDVCCLKAREGRARCHGAPIPIRVSDGPLEMSLPHPGSD